MRLRPSVPISPKVACLIVKKKVPLSAPPNITLIVFVVSSTDTVLSCLTIVVFAELVTLT